HATAPSFARFPSTTLFRSTGGNVVDTGHATGVEGAHGQLGAGFADRLGGDDADRLAHLDQLARGQVAPVAADADAVPGAAREDGADLHLIDAGVLDGGGEHLVDHLVLFQHRLARTGMDDGGGGDPARDPVAQRHDDLLRVAGHVFDGGDANPLGGAAVLL